MDKITVFIVRTAVCDEPVVCVRVEQGANPSLLQHAKNIFQDYLGHGKAQESEKEDAVFELSVQELDMEATAGMYRVVTANGLTAVGINTNKKIRERVAALSWAIAAQVFKPKKIVPDPDKHGSFAALVAQAAEGLEMVEGSAPLPEALVHETPQLGTSQSSPGLKRMGVGPDQLEFKLNPHFHLEDYGTEKPRIGVRGDSLLVFKNAGKKAKHYMISDDLQKCFREHTVDVKCEVGAKVKAITKTISGGRQIECLFVAIGCNDLEDTKGLVAAYPEHLDEDLRSLCQAIFERSKCSLILFGGPGHIWKYPPKWDAYVQRAHTVLLEEGANVVPTEMAGELLSKLILHRDGVHFENSDESRQYLANTVGKWIQTCIEQCLNDGESMEWPTPTETPPPSAARVAPVSCSAWTGSKKRPAYEETDWDDSADMMAWGVGGGLGMPPLGMASMMSMMMEWGGGGGGVMAGQPGCKWCQMGECWDHQGATKRLKAF